VADRVDGVEVVVEVAFGVGHGAGGFAKHVVGVAIAGVQLGRAVPECFTYGASQHELVPHDFHCLGHGGADHRLAEPLHHAL